MGIPQAWKIVKNIYGSYSVYYGYKRMWPFQNLRWELEECVISEDAAKNFIEADRKRLKEPPLPQVLESGEF